MITSSIVLYNTNRDDLKKLLACVLSSIIDKIYIIDNSPTNELNTISNTSRKIEYVFNNANIGYGAAHNIALRKSIETCADYHVILNPDTYFEGGTIEALTDYMNQNSDVGAVMPMIKYPDGSVQHLCKLQPTPLDLFGRRFFPEFLMEKRKSRYELTHSGYDKLANIPCLSGCFMFLRVDTLKEVGIFDERFFMYCEDFDFYRKIHARHKTMFYPYATVTHVHQKGSYRNRRLLLQHMKSAFLYFNKWGWFFDADRKKTNKKTLETLRVYRNR